MATRIPREHTERAARTRPRASAIIVATVARHDPASRWTVFSGVGAVAVRPGGYLTGIIRCWYGVPGHMTYGFFGSAALFG
jgi:hypothetical protein